MLTAREAPGGADLFSFPRKIQLQTQNRCNFACSMCPYPTTAAGDVRLQMDEQVFQQIIDQVGESGHSVKLCLMLQNEPLLDRRFVKLLDYADAVAAISSISSVTNGSVLTARLLDQLTAYEKFRLTISVNALDGSRYQAVHGRDNWTRIHGLLTTWKGPHERVRLSFVLDSESVDEARAFQEYWTPRGYRIRFVPLNSRANTLSTGTSPVTFVDRDFGYCQYPVDTLSVLADGSVILCCNDWRHNQRYGDLRRESIADVWNSRELRRLRTAAIQGSLRSAAPICTNCDYPKRSADRVRLEAMFSGSGVTAGLEGPEIMIHETVVRAPDEPGEMRLFVSHIDRNEGLIVGLMETSEPLPELPEQILFEFRIGHERYLSFGSLDPVSCPGRLVVLDMLEDAPGLEAVLVRLDRQAPEYQLLPWYRSDWATATSQLGV